jgi:hypothetical protein
MPLSLILRTLRKGRGVALNLKSACKILNNFESLISVMLIYFCICKNNQHSFSFIYPISHQSQSCYFRIGKPALSFKATPLYRKRKDSFIK